MSVRRPWHPVLCRAPPLEPGPPPAFLGQLRCAPHPLCRPELCAVSRAPCSPPSSLNTLVPALPAGGAAPGPPPVFPSLLPDSTGCRGASEEPALLWGLRARPARTAPGALSTRHHATGHSGFARPWCLCTGRRNARGLSSGAPRTRCPGARTRAGPQGPASRAHPSSDAREEPESGGATRRTSETGPAFPQSIKYPSLQAGHTSLEAVF